MKKIIGAVALFAVLLCTGCSHSIAMDKIKGNWTCDIDGTSVTIEITDDRFTQSAGENSGEPLKFERTSDGMIVRNTDGRELIQVHYSEEDDQLYYTVQTPQGDTEYRFSRAAG